jgi:hypothetical protein
VFAQQLTVTSRSLQQSQQQLSKVSDTRKTA